MKLISYETPQGLKLGIQTHSGIINVAGVSLRVFGDESLADPNLVYAQGISVLPQLQQIESAATADDLLHEEIKYGPCVPNPQKVICVGLNYARHADEAGLPHPTTPVLFSKFANSLAGHQNEVPIPAGSEQVDYEAELVAIIGRRARNVEEEDALNYVMGYCNGNDISARDLQMRTSQWLLGKTCDRFLPIGPYIVTADEMPNPQNQTIKLWLNGELRQNSNTADMIFSVAQCIAYASRYMTLEPGDIISTGTPEGVILGHKEKVWLKPGDQLTVEVEGLGSLTNIMGVSK